MTGVGNYLDIYNKDYKGKQHHISNLEQSLDAAQNCYMVLLRFLKQFPLFSKNQPLPWQEIVDSISNLFIVKRELETRIKAWQKIISNGSLGFRPEDKDGKLDYNDKQWFRAAVNVIKAEDGTEDETEYEAEVETEYETDQYERKSGFETSDWKYFHDAAAFHRFTILNEILSDYGIICG